jgi:hypothetical protein
MGKRVFDVMAVHRDSGREAIWRIHGCDDPSDAAFVASEYDRRYGREHVIGSPAPADGVRPADLELNQSGQTVASATGSAAAERGATLVDLSPATLRALRAEVWKAVLIAWAIAGTISFVAAFLLVAMRGGA